MLKVNDYSIGYLVKRYREGRNSCIINRLVYNKDVPDCNKCKFVVLDGIEYKYLHTACIYASNVCR